VKLPTYHLGIELSFNDCGIAAMILRRPGVQNADLPPEPSPHLNVEGCKPKMAAVSVDSQRLRNAHSQPGKRPYLSRIVVSPQDFEKHNKRLQDDHFVAEQEICPRKALLQAKAISMQERIAVFPALLGAFIRRHAGDGSIVYGKHERFQGLCYLVRI
jgi:hypothetical protein